MKEWEKRAIDLLYKTLIPLPQESNEVDWKTNLSDKKERLAQHCSAFANQDGGGFLVFGIDDNGKFIGLAGADIAEIIKKIGNIVREAILPPVAIDHIVLTLEGKEILLVHIPESTDKPVHLRGHGIEDSFIRSAGQTRKITRTELKILLSKSTVVEFSSDIATEPVSASQIINLLDFTTYYGLVGRAIPSDSQQIIRDLTSENFLKRGEKGYGITNLGALLFARNIRDFNHLARKAVRVVIYEGNSRLAAIKEQEGQKGYANGFSGLIDYVCQYLPQNEAIGQVLRKQVTMYPPIAIRELVANALIHQDLYESGGPIIEIFSDRIEITNPGRPIIPVLRFIDSPSKSRNDKLASVMRKLGIAEERGSGIDKVINAVEIFQLPAPDFIETNGHLKTVIYSYKELASMDKKDRIRACYQHCCLKHVCNERMTNQTLRQRFNISDSNYPMASKIISETVDEGLIKPHDPESKSRKYAAYIPFWA